MISPDEIKKQALKWWKPFLQSLVREEPFFPRQIDRIGKVQPGDITRRFEALKAEIDALYKFSKNETGRGYRVLTSGRNFRRTGAHELPDGILLETADDFLQVTGKAKEYRLFQQHYQLLAQSLPALKEWIGENVLLLTAPAPWEDLLKVCHYFLAHPRPQLYIRQLPVPVPTKFIEEQAPLLQSLLDFLLPGHIRNPLEKRFAERYFLRTDEPLVRIRVLDEQLPPFRNITDLSIRLSDFEATAWPCDRIFITENKMNFLTLPPAPSAIAIWSGGGFKVSYLKRAAWLGQKKIYYWGDIDEHGFQILHQVRSYYPQTQSLMMDRQTFDNFEAYAVAGERNRAERLSHLQEEEAALYDWLKAKEQRNRLEQEKIPQAYVDAVIRQIK